MRTTKRREVKGARAVKQFADAEFGVHYEVEGGYEFDYLDDDHAGDLVTKFEHGLADDVKVGLGKHTVGKVTVFAHGHEITLSRDDLLALHASLKVAMRLYHAEKAETKTKREEYER